MKNAKQLVELNHIEKPKIRKIFEEEYRELLTSSDNYFRYYPNDSSFDKTKNATKKINKWLLKSGYVIDATDPFFHLLIRWDW